MKKISLLVLTVFLIQICKAQGPGWLWAISSNGGSYEYANGISVDTTGHFFVGFRGNGTITFGSKSANAPGANNPFVGGFDTSSTCNWLQEYTYSYGEDYPWGFCKDKNDNVYSGGVTNSGSTSPMFIEKYDKNGNLKWHVTLEGGGLSAMGLAADGAGCVYVTGAFQNAFGSPTFGSTTLTYTGSYQAVFIAKMDSNGNWLWAKMADGIGSNDGYDVGRGLAIDQYANIYISGGYYNTPTFGTITVPSQTGTYPSLFVAEYDSSGNAVNVTTATNAGFNNGDCCTLNHIVVDSCGYFYVTGYFQGTAQFGTFLLSSQGAEDVYVAKCSNSGVWQWANDIGGSGNDQGQAIALDKTSDVYVGGSYQNSSATLSGSGNWGDSSISGGNIFIAKYANSTGALQWVKSQNAGGGGVGGLAVDNQNYMYVIGSYTGSIGFGSTTLNATSNSTVFIAKLDTVPPRRIIPVVDSSYCPGSTATISYTLEGTFNSGNVFTVQLSDSTGSFVDDTDIGSVTSNSNGTITITIPANTPPGSNYLIRVVSSNPAASSYANGCGAYYANNVYPNDFYVTIGGNGAIIATISPSDTSVCMGAPVNLTASGGISYSWSNGDTSKVITVNPTTDSVFTLTANNGCGTAVVNDTITVTPSPALVIQPPASSAAVCVGQGIALSAPVSGSGYTWSPSSTLNSSTGDTVIASPTVTTTYMVTGISSGGCISAGLDTVSIVPAPPFYITPPSQSICGNTSIVLSVPASGTDYVWSPSSSVSPSTGDMVTATPTVATTYTVTGVDSLGCTVTASDTISISPTPEKPTITQNGNELISSATQGNQWLRNDSAILGATNQTYIATQAGYYQVIAENPANGCNATSDSTSVTGINQLSAIGNQLSVYPNPTGGELFVKISSSVMNIKDWNLEVTDLLGRTIYTRISLNYNNEIDLSTLPGGVYFITIINNTTRAVLPVVKQN